MRGLTAFLCTMMVLPFIMLAGCGDDDASHDQALPNGAESEAIERAIQNACGGPESVVDWNSYEDYDQGSVYTFRCKDGTYDRVEIG